MDDERGGRALTRRFLELVGPAAIIGHRPATEWAVQALRAEIRVVDKDDHRLALHIHAGIVVPAALRRVDAIADEHHLAARDLHRWRLAIGDGHEIAAIAEAKRLCAAGDGERREILRGDLHQRYVLEPAAIIARLQTCRLEALHHQRLGLFFPHRARRAALKCIGGQLPRHILHRLLGDRRHRDGAARRLCHAIAGGRAAGQLIEALRRGVRHMGAGRQHERGQGGGGQKLDGHEGGDPLLKRGVVPDLAERCSGGKRRPQ